MSNRKLSEEDQKRVDDYLHAGYNKTERKPFRPWLLLLFWLVIVTIISVASLYIASINGLSGGR